MYDKDTGKVTSSRNDLKSMQLKVYGHSNDMTAPSVAVCSFHRTPDRQTVKVNHAKCDFGLLMWPEFEWDFCCKLLCGNAEKAVHGKSSFSSGKKQCLIQFFYGNCVLILIVCNVRKVFFFFAPQETKQL